MQHQLMLASLVLWATIFALAPEWQGTPVPNRSPAETRRWFQDNCEASRPLPEIARATFEELQTAGLEDSVLEGWTVALGPAGCDWRLELTRQESAVAPLTLVIHRDGTLDRGQAEALVRQIEAAESCDVPGCGPSIGRGEVLAAALDAAITNEILRPEPDGFEIVSFAQGCEWRVDILWMGLQLPESPVVRIDRNGTVLTHFVDWSEFWSQSLEDSEDP